MLNNEGQEIKKPLRKPFYNLMTDKQLRSLLKDAGLSAIGNKNTLIRRHQLFVKYYNSYIHEGKEPHLPVIRNKITICENDVAPAVVDFCDEMQRKKYCNQIVIFSE
jgi:SAP domain-containing protein